LSPIEILSEVMSFLALLKARSHSQDVTGQANISKAESLLPKISLAVRVSVPTAPLRSSPWRSGSVFIASEVTILLANAEMRRKVLFDTEISFSRLPALIYTIYSLPYTIFGLGARHTGLLGALNSNRTVRQVKRESRRWVSAEIIVVFESVEETCRRCGVVA
jgi:hypothetical protein